MYPHDQNYFKKFANDGRKSRKSLSDPQASSLALGCGAGVEIDWLARKGCTNITGRDISNNLLQECREKFGIRTVNADMRRTGLPDKSFDVIVSCRSLHHMFYPYETLEEMVGLAKKMLWIVAEPVKTKVKEILRKIAGKRIISGANIYEFQFELDDVFRYVAFNGMEQIAVWRFWESSAQRAPLCRMLNGVVPFLGNRFTAVHQAF